MTRTWLVRAGIAGIVVAMLGGGIALARGGATSPASAAKDHHVYQQMFIDRLAARLGISADALTSAGKQAAEDVIAQALKDGKITQQEATELRARLNGNDFGFFGRFGFHKHHGKFGAMREVFTTGFDALASKLGMSSSALRESLRSGKTVADLAKARGVTLATLGAAVADAVKPVLDRLVKDGTVSQERADSLLAKIGSGEFFAHSGFIRHAA